VIKENAPREWRSPFQEPIKGKVALTCPVFAFGKPKWVIILTKEGGNFLKEDGLLLGTYASLCGMVYERLSYLSHLEREVEARTRKLLGLQKELERANLLLREQAIRDPLTGVYNRRFLDEILDKPPASFDRYTMILMDLDGFKEVNDLYGHRVGDYVLKAVARTLQNRIRLEDYIFRFGGDEFIIFLPGVGEGVAERVADRLRRALEEERYYYRYEDKTLELKLTGSFGVVVVEDPKLLRKGLSEADSLMYQAKREGGNQIKFKKVT
jgi:diguanylate cyclase (GGDEF)-like protein